MPRYSVKIDEREFDINLDFSSDETSATVNGRKVLIESHRLTSTRTLLSVNNKKHEVEIEPNGNGTRLVFLNGFDLKATVEDYHLSQLKKAAGITGDQAVETKLKAAMPGLVVEIKVAPGDMVTGGMPLLVLEAMKMENVLKAKGDATVKAIKVATGAAVEKGDILMEFE